MARRHRGVLRASAHPRRPARARPLDDDEGLQHLRVRAQGRSSPSSEVARAVPGRPHARVRRARRVRARGRCAGRADDLTRTGLAGRRREGPHLQARPLRRHGLRRPRHPVGRRATRRHRARCRARESDGGRGGGARPPAELVDGAHLLRGAGADAVPRGIHRCRAPGRARCVDGYERRSRAHHGGRGVVSRGSARSQAPPVGELPRQRRDDADGPAPRSVPGSDTGSRRRVVRRALQLHVARDGEPARAGRERALLARSHRRSRTCLATVPRGVPEHRAARAGMPVVAARTGTRPRTGRLGRRGARRPATRDCAPSSNGAAATGSMPTWPPRWNRGSRRGSGRRSSCCCASTSSRTHGDRCGR